MLKPFGRVVRRVFYFWCVYRRLLAVLFLFFCVLCGGAQNQGVPLIVNYEPSTYKAHPQNWGITQLSSGEILVSNDYGLLIYNGRQWSIIEEELGYTSHAISTIDHSVYVGGENVIFKVNTNSKGELIFSSVLPNLPDSISKFGIVEGIVSLEGKVVFHSENYLFVIDGNKFEFVYSENRIRKIFSVNSQLYASIDERGLLRVENNTFVPTVGYKKFIDNNPIFMSEVKGGIQVLTEKKGFFFIDLDVYGYERKVTKLTSKLDSFLSKDNLNSCVVINEDLIGVSTENNGFFVLKDLDKIEFHFEIPMGIQDEDVRDVYQDSFGSLWLALNNGISKIELRYPMSQFDGRSGLEGIVESITTHEDKIYAATHSGVYSLNENDKSFKEMAPIQAWDIISVGTEADNKLLIATNEDISEITKQGSINKIMDCYPWKMHQLDVKSNTVLIGTDPGLSAIKWENESWVVGIGSQKLTSAISNFTNSKDGLWLGARESNLYGLKNIKWKGDSVFYEGLHEHEWDEGLPEGDVNTFKWKGTVLFGTTSGIFEKEDESFRLISFIKGFDSLTLLHRAYNWNDKELWAITLKDNNFQFGFVDQQNNWNYRLFNPIANDVIHTISSDGNNNILLGGASGIFKYQRQNNFDIETPYLCKLSKVSVMEDSLIHGGYWQDSLGVFTTVQPKSTIPFFHYKTDAISFEYSSISFGQEKGIQYSYWLEGNDTKWSKWTSEHKKEYTNLPPGDYIFKVKAINVFETESKVAEYRFTINKPWFQSPWYYAGQTSVLALLVFLTIFLNHSENPSPYSSVIAFVTIITVFEFLIMVVEPYLIQYTGEIPVFNLIMNILLAMSLAPVERLIKKYLARKNHV